MTKDTLKKIAVNLLLPVTVMVVIIVTFFKDISFKDIADGFLKIPGTYLLVFVLLTILGTVLRTYKYYILLSRKLPFGDVFLITLVRNFSVDLLPGRAAALIFYSWLTKKRGIHLTEGTSSFVVSVFYDALGLAFMLSGLLFFLETPFPQGPFFLAVAVISCASLCAVFFTDKITGFILKKKMLQRFPRMEHVLVRIDAYLNQHKSNSERLQLFALSLAARVVKYVFIFILFEGVVNLGIGMKQFSLFSFGLAGTELSALFPIQGPAGFGTWEMTFTLIFEALKIPAANIKAAGFVIHITTQVWEYTIGLTALAYLFFIKPVQEKFTVEHPTATELEKRET